MTGPQFAEILETLGLSRPGAAKFLDIGPRTLRRYLKAGPPRADAMLLRVMVAQGLTPAAVLTLAGIDINPAFLLRDTSPPA